LEFFPVDSISLSLKNACLDVAVSASSEGRKEESGWHVRRPRAMPRHVSLSLSRFPAFTEGHDAMFWLFAGGCSQMEEE
jgi:hypothetical protein